MSIPVPGTNDPNNGEISWITSGITIPDSTYVKVSIDGTVAVATHPAYLAFAGNHATHNGKTVGPVGISSNELRVRVELLDSAGAVRFTYSGYPAASIDASVSTVQKLNHGGSFRVMRKGVTGGASCTSNPLPGHDPSCPGGTYSWSTPAYTLSGAQNLQIESFDPFDFDDASGEIVKGATAATSVTPHPDVGGLSQERWWYREGDTLAMPIGVGGVYLGSCANESECGYEPQASGRFYLRTTVSAGGSHQETVPGEVVWVRDYGCDDERDQMIHEYVTHVGVNLLPDCADFDDSGGTTHFSWSELNGGFAQGNPHDPWGIVRANLKTGLESTRTHYGYGVLISSGYRCPHGNAAVGGHVNSAHMHGTAADLYSADNPWNEAEFDLLRAATLLAGATTAGLWGSYGSHHLHVGF